MPVRPEHIVNLSGKSFVLFPGLLHLAHESGLRSIETELVQIPAADNGNCAIIRALARFAGAEEDAIWSAYGDASPANTRGPITHALIRMAETRAVGRVLRMACDVGETMLEELADEESAAPRGGNGHSGVSDRSDRSDRSDPSDRRPVRAEPATTRPAVSAPAGTEGEPLCQVCQKPLNKNEVVYSQHHCKLNLCREHADEMKPKA